MTSQTGAAVPADGAAPKLTFHCQLAHGSPTGIISGFTNVRELYKCISETFDIDPSEIIFCTLNTHKCDMNKLLGGQIGLNDFIFAHVRGQPKEAEINKTDDSLGLTITDNGAGSAFIKRIRDGSIVDKHPLCAVGDLIERLNGQSMIGKRHFEVAKLLREIPHGATFTLRLIEPLKSGFAAIGPSSRKAGRGGVGSGKETLRLRSSGQPATVQVSDDVMAAAVEKINRLLEAYMGISDSELAQSVWEAAEPLHNPSDFLQAINAGELAEFGFTEDVVFDMWGAILDARQGRPN